MACSQPQDAIFDRTNPGRVVEDRDVRGETPRAGLITEGKAVQLTVELTV
jgi:hypothetical protein